MNRSLAAGLGVLALLSAPAAAAADDGRLVWSHFTGDASGTARIVSARRTVDLGCADPCDSDQIPGWTPDGRHITFTRIVRPVRPGERLGALGRAPRRGPRR